MHVCACVHVSVNKQVIISKRCNENMCGGLTIQAKMSLAIAEISCRISPPLSSAMEDCSIIRVLRL